MAIHERNDGSTLSPADRRKLGEAMKGKVVTKGESPPEQYDPLVRRWNEAFTSRAVWTSLSSTKQLVLILSRVSSHFLKASLMSQLASISPLSITWMLLSLVGGIRITAQAQVKAW